MHLVVTNLFDAPFRHFANDWHYPSALPRAPLPPKVLSDAGQNLRLSAAYCILRTAHRLSYQELNDGLRCVRVPPSNDPSTLLFCSRLTSAPDQLLSLRG